MCVMYLGYALFYFSRKTLTYVNPILLKESILDYEMVGTLSSVFSIMYGLSKFISGMISDHSNPRFFMGIGLFATGITNILFGFSSTFPVMLTLWIFNAFFQGWGWPPCSKLLTTWYSQTERGLWWSTWNTAHNVGGAIIPILVGYIVKNHGWKAGMIIPGIISCVGGIVVCWLLRDTPASIGLPSIGQWRRDKLEIIHESRGSGFTPSYFFVNFVLKNKYIWLFSASYLLVYFIRTAINDWGNIYLTQHHNLDLLTANKTIALFEIGGFFGSLVAGWASDFCFRSNRGPINFIFALGILSVVLMFLHMPSQSLLLLRCAFFMAGFFIFGPQMLIGVAAAERSHKSVSGSATGFIGLFAYLGSALAGLPMGAYIKSHGWDNTFIILAWAAGLVSLLLSLVIRHKDPTLDGAGGY